MKGTGVGEMGVPPERARVAAGVAAGAGREVACGAAAVDWVGLKADSFPGDTGTDTIGLRRPD
jgi:hypothetical protein